MEKNDTKPTNKKKLAIIIVLLLIFCIIIIGIVTAISNNDKANKIKSDLDKQTEEIYKLYGGKENYEKEKVFNQIAEELSESQQLYDIKFEDDSYNVTFILIQEKNPNKIYNWVETGIPEGQTHILDRDTRNRLTNLYGPEYIYADKAEYYIYNRNTSEIQNRTSSVEETIIASKWEGYKYNWTRYNNEDNNIVSEDNTPINNTSNVIIDSNNDSYSDSNSNISQNTNNTTSNDNNSSVNNSTTSNNNNSSSKDNSEEIARLNSFIQDYEKEKEELKTKHNEYLKEVDEQINRYNTIISELKIALQKNESGYQGEFIDTPNFEGGRVSNSHTEITNQISWNTRSLENLQKEREREVVEYYNFNMNRINGEINKIQEEINKLK